MTSFTRVEFSGIPVRDVNGETVRVFGRPEELAERREASGYDNPG